MQSRFVLLSSAFAIGCAASVAYAQPPELGRSGGRLRILPVIAAIDADADGVISASEMEKAAIALKSLDKEEATGTLLCAGWRVSGSQRYCGSVGKKKPVAE